MKISFKINEVARELHIERRQRQGLVVNNLDRGSAASKDDDRPKGRIVGEPRNELARPRSHDHWLDKDAGDASVGPNGSRAIEDLRCCVAHGRRRREVQPHTAGGRGSNGPDDWIG